MPPAMNPRTVAAFEALHLAACALLGIEPGYGAARRVAHAIGVGETQYSQVSRGERAATLELLCTWAGKLGLTVCIPPEGPIRIEP